MNKKTICFSSLKAFFLALDNLVFSLNENAVINFFFVYSEISFLPDSDELLWCSMTRGTKGNSHLRKIQNNSSKFLFTKREIRRLSPKQTAMWETK